jgi:hypothetical protein
MDDALTLLKKTYDQSPGVLSAVVGAGASAAASGGAQEATWPGLLRAGVRRCRRVDPDMTPRQAELLLEQAADGNTEMMLAVASVIEARLREKQGAYAQWLADTVGSLTLHDGGRILLDAIDGLGMPILTTNYDDLLEEATGRTPGTLDSHESLEACVRSWDTHVLHLHGHWRNADSVVLGPAAYDRLLHNEVAATFMKSETIRRGLLYVGVGAGVRDPNFEGLRRWIRDNLQKSRYRDFRLVLGSELVDAHRIHATDRIEPVAFGATVEELPGFLRALKGGTLSSVSQNADDYVTGATVSFPSVGILDHAGSATESLGDAVECAGRINRLLGQLTNRTREPVGMVDWEEEDKILLAQRMIMSLSGPAEQLRHETDHIHGAVRDADAAVAHLLAALNNADPDSRAHTRRTLGSITELRNLLAYATETYAALHHDLTARRLLTGRWQQALDLLEDTRPGLEGAHAVADGWVVTPETA